MNALKHSERGPFHQIGNDLTVWYAAYDDFGYSLEHIYRVVSAPYVTPKIGERPGVDLQLHQGSLVDLIEGLRDDYISDYHDFLSRRVPGYKRERLLIEDDPKEFSEEERAELPAMRKALYGKNAGNPGYFHEDRDRCDPPLSKFPILVNIYGACNRWWRTHIAAPESVFRPDFDSIDVAVSIAENLPEMNPSARFFVLVTQAIDPRYSVDEMRKVHDEYYRRLDTSFSED